MTGPAANESGLMGQRNLSEPVPAVRDLGESEIEAIRARAYREAPAAKRRVYALNHAGQRYMVKQSAAGRSLPRALGGALLVRFLAGHWPRLGPLRLGQADQLHYEAARLRALHAQGQSVPEVVLVSDDHLIMQDVGPPLTQVMRSLDVAGQAELACRVASELADFHRRGHWHGGAQLRNHTQWDDRLYRIDFEEPLDQTLTLPARQAMDLMLLVHSATAIKAFDGEQRRELCCRLLDDYLRQGPPQAVLEAVRRGHHIKRRLKAMLGWARRWTGKDLERIWLTTEAVETVLPRLAADHRSSAS
ncbi:serine/threonine protein phosphatase [Methylonatrum kenyense]|uniref:serine/threonine protein phosphatase n=1 Tax=Methylonatrum kenyense TaxID=455253 RepID=UPI0020C0762E|nr:serine/threonine protein phosphatase [Methylonatrum kenyense]MCK8516678.1 serine/threonine protein phosphatase [Methylonatrum kenyense]